MDQRWIGRGRALVAVAVAASSLIIGIAATPVAPRIQPPAAAAAAAGCINLSHWSLAQRINQLLMVSGQFSNLSASLPYARNGVGAFVLFGQPPAGSGPAISSGIASLDNAARASGQVVPWMSTDEEGGPVQRLSYVIGALPSPRQMAALWTPAQIQSAMTSHASAMWNLGITMDLAPVMDTASPTNTIAAEDQRSFSENGQTAATDGIAFATGLQAGSVIPVLKHFPGLGHANANTDLGPATTPSLSQLQANDLIPFQRGIAAGFPAVMVEHASVPGLSGTVPASLSAATYQYLRGTLHFAGVAMTDSLSAGAISAFGYAPSAAATRALQSGADMVMIPVTSWQATVTALQNAVGSGALPLAQVDASVTRILQTKGLAVCTVTLAPNGVTFGNQPLQTTSAVQTSTLTVAGNTAVTINAISISGDFAQTNTCGALPATFNPGTGCSISVSFTPAAQGVRSGAVSIGDSAGGDQLSLTGYSYPFHGAYTLDAWAGLHAGGGSPPLVDSAYYPNWNHARSGALLPEGGGGYVLDAFGGIHAFGNIVTVPSAYFGWDIARDIAFLPSATASAPQGYTLDGYGGVHQFGNAPAPRGFAYWPGWSVAVRMVLLSDGTGGYVMDAYGGLHGFSVGSNPLPPVITNEAYWPNWTIARDVALAPGSTINSVTGITLDGYGGVHPFGQSGSVTDEAYWGGWDIARAVRYSPDSTAANPKGWTLDGWGGCHSFGGAPALPPAGYWPNHDLAVQLIIS